MMPTIDPSDRPVTEPSAAFIEDLSSGLDPVDAQDRLRDLHTTLADRADSEGLLDVAYRTLDTPVGLLLLAATNEGLVRIAYPSAGHDAALQDLADQISPRVLHAPHRLDRAATELDEYFHHKRRAFDLPLDRRLSSGFRRTVLDRLATSVAFGTTASYGAIAHLADSPRAARAVGTACATNPIPIVVPCHRVVRGDGQIGDYVGGTNAKRILLDLERVK